MGVQVKCPVCEEVFKADDELQPGNLIWCDNCYARLKVISEAPLKVESWEEDDDEYYEDEKDNYGKRNRKEEWA